MGGGVADYPAMRDRVAQDGCSDLSEPLTYGEIGPRTIWHAGWRALHQGAAGAEAFLRQLVWREFAWHLMYHAPDMDRENWRPDWDAFPWRGDNPDAERWRRGMTGEPFVDAAMRQMYVTGRMHNRARMIAASYLTKHLLTDWRVGLRWFADCLTDWDPAANAMGWQWVAGSGPDAAPYFRVFNPATQAEKFDPNGRLPQQVHCRRPKCTPARGHGVLRGLPGPMGPEPRSALPGPGDRAGRGTQPGACGLCGALTQAGPTASSSKIIGSRHRIRNNSNRVREYGDGGGPKGPGRGLV